MADLHLPYGGGFVTVRSERAQGIPIFEPVQQPVLTNVTQAFIDAASYQTVGSPGLHQMVQPNQKYTIVVRGPGQLWMGQYELIPAVIYYLTQLGVPSKNIALLVGGATEGRIELPELDAVIHPNLRRELERVICHDPDARDLVDIGTTSGGVAVKISPWIIDRNVIVIDSVRPHGILGFTGGAHALLQVCARQTARAMLRLAVQQDAMGLAAGITTGSLTDNPLCSAISEIGSLVHPFFAAYSLPTSSNTPCHVVCGNWWDCWVESCRRFYSLLGTPVTSQVGAVLASSGGAPFDNTFRTTITGLYHSVQLLQPGGGLFYAAQCSSGGPDSFFAFLQDGGLPGLHQRLRTGNGTLDELLLLGVAAYCQAYRVHIQSKLSASELAFANIKTFRTMETMEMQVPFDQTSVCILTRAVSTFPYFA